MKRSEQDLLLREILGGDATEDVRRRSLELGLVALRHRRRRRQVLIGAFATAAVVAIAVLVATRQPGSPEIGPLVATDSAPAFVDYISDDKLRALLADRAYALIGPPGQQELVFLDELVAGSRL